MSTTTGQSPRRVDVVILTALTLEYQAAKQVDAGATQGSQWREEKSPLGLPVAFRSFQGKRGRPLRVALAQAGDIGAVKAVLALHPLVAAYRPRCIAMSGVCAGRPGKTNLGDVVAAERLFFHDAGKRLPGDILADPETYNLRRDWKVALEHFDFAKSFQQENWWKQRPIPYELQENWVLHQLLKEVPNPASLPECEEFCPQWEKVIESLWKSGYVWGGTCTLTYKGRKRIASFLTRHRQDFPDVSPRGSLWPFKVHVAPIGSGNQVVEDETIWKRIIKSMRKVLGLEMEAAALGAMADSQRTPRLDALVMKGVMDFADQGRDDHFKEFAARASAECLLAFLREHFEPEVIPNIDDLLEPGTPRKLPLNPLPSEILHAGFEAVPFHEQGRTKILAELDRWCDEGPSVAVGLLHAEGGVGKTRLAIEWTRRRRDLGWVAGFLQKGVPQDWFERLWALEQPVLVVLDYAESRSEDLFKTLEQLLRYHDQTEASPQRRVRLLLLARNAGGWWQSLKERDTALGLWLNRALDYALPPLAVNLTDRQEVFHEAAERFAELRGKKHGRHTLPSLDDARFERVLYLHMAALASVDELKVGIGDLMDAILDHEEKFWQLRVQEHNALLARHRTLARQVIAAATLRGGFAEESAASRVVERLLGRVLSSDERDLLQQISWIYQHAARAPGTFLPALEPDLLGEGLVLRMASPRKTQVPLPEDWIDRVLPPDADESAMRTGLQVMGRASATQPKVLRPWVERLLAGSLLRQRARLVLEVAKTVGTYTAFSELGDVLARRLGQSRDTALARELDTDEIPRPSTSLGRLGARISILLLKDLPTSSDEEQVLAERARHLTHLSIRLSDLGRRRMAWMATHKAVDLFRVLARHNAEAFKPELASSLNNLGAMLTNLGRREEALESSREAVDLLRALARRNPVAYGPTLAGSLNTLGNCLSDLGQREEALEASGEAVDLCRSLAQCNPETCRPALAGSLNNLSNKLSDLGRAEEALEASREAVDLFRSLAQHNPEAFRQDLAMSLDTLGNKLSALGRHEEALEASREAVDFYRALARRNPEPFRPALAGSLNNLGGMLSMLGRYEEALEASSQAVDLLRVLAQRNPAAFMPSLATSLDNLGSRLSMLGRREDALEPTREALHLRRNLAQRNPEAFMPSLASSLDSLGNRLRDLGRAEEALEASREAVDLYRALEHRNPEAFRPSLATSLNNLGAMLSDLSRREEALEALSEAVDLLRALAQRNPEAYGLDLAMCLNNLGAIVSKMGRHEEALEVSSKAVDLLRPLAQHNRDAFRPYLARCLKMLGNSLSDLSRHEEALEASREAVDLLRPLAQSTPEAFRPDLAGSLNSLGNSLRALDRGKESLEPTSEAVSLFRGLAQRHPEVFSSSLAGSLNNLGNCLIALGRHKEALEASREAVDLYRTLAQHNPEAFRHELAMSLNNLGAMLSEMGRRQEALEVSRETVDLYRALAQRDPESFRSSLAMSLNNLGISLSALGRYEDALETLHEALGLRRNLAQHNPEVFRPSLANSLNTLGAMLSDLGRREEALETSREAVDLFRGLAQGNPGAFRSSLAASLNILGISLRNLGRREEALEATREGIDLYKALAQRDPESFRPSLAASLDSLSTGLAVLGRHEEALGASSEAVDLYRALAQHNPESFRPALARSLKNLGHRLSDLGRGEDALGVLIESVDLIWPFFKHFPAAFQKTTGSMLSGLQGLYNSLQRPLPAALEEYIASFENITRGSQHENPDKE